MPPCRRARAGRSGAGWQLGESHGQDVCSAPGRERDRFQSSGRVSLTPEGRGSCAVSVCEEGRIDESRLWHDSPIGQLVGGGRELVHAAVVVVDDDHLCVRRAKCGILDRREQLGVVDREAGLPSSRCRLRELLVLPLSEARPVPDRMSELDDCVFGILRTADRACLGRTVADGHTCLAETSTSPLPEGLGALSPRTVDPLVEVDDADGCVDGLVFHELGTGREL